MALKSIDSRVLHDIDGAVAGAAVGIHDHRAVSGEVFGQARLYGPNDMTNGFCVIEARNADNDFGGTDLVELLVHIGS